MQAPGGNRARHESVPRTQTVWVCAALVAACALSAARLASAQASQSAPPSNTAQSSKPGTQAPAGQAVPASAPMVMGENPDSTSDTVSSSVPQTGNPSQPPAIPVPASGSGQPLAASSQPVEAPGQPASVPVPANAGGDQARQQIDNECANLLKMANDLKAQMDKTTKDMLSVGVVRKAGEIEQLAHHVKDEMRPALAKD